MANKKRKNRVKAGLTIKASKIKVVDLRSVLIQRQKQLGWSTYKVAKAVKGKMSTQAVYDFLSGRSETTTSSNLLAILEALGLEIAPKDKR